MPRPAHDEPTTLTVTAADVHMTLMALGVLVSLCEMTVQCHEDASDDYDVLFAQAKTLTRKIVAQLPPAWGVTLQEVSDETV